MVSGHPDSLVYTFIDIELHPNYIWRYLLIENMVYLGLGESEWVTFVSIL